MTAIISKPAQNRLDSCALARPKWAKIRKPRRKHTRGALRTDILEADAAVRVENAQQNGQTCGNTKPLGKYRVTICNISDIFQHVMVNFQPLRTLDLPHR